MNVGFSWDDVRGLRVHLFALDLLGMGLGWTSVGWWSCLREDGWTTAGFEAFCSLGLSICHRAIARVPSRSFFSFALYLCSHLPPSLQRRRWSPFGKTEGTLLSQLQCYSQSGYSMRRLLLVCFLQSHFVRRSEGSRLRPIFCSFLNGLLCFCGCYALSFLCFFLFYFCALFSFRSALASLWIRKARRA